MARYINADELTALIQKKLNENQEKRGTYAYYALETFTEILQIKAAADVVPRRILFDLESKLHTMLPFKVHPIPIDGKCTGDSYELGKEHVIYDILNYLGELEKKYTAQSKDKSFIRNYMCNWVSKENDDGND